MVLASETEASRILTTRIQQWVVPMKLRCLLLAVAFVLQSSLLPAGGAWSSFRGPNGSGVSESGKLPTRFGPEENVHWKTPLPPGHSSPVFSPESIFLTGFSDEAAITLALNRTTGKLRWRSETPRIHRGNLHEANSPASPSPVTDGSNVYVFFQDVGLLSYGAEGKERWRVPLGPFNTPFGIAASPVVAGDHIIQVCDGETGSFIVGVEKNTGRLAWRDERPNVRRGFSTPVLHQPPDGRGLQALVSGTYQLIAYAADSGRRVWWVDGLTWQLKPTPVMDEDSIYVLGWAGGTNKGRKDSSFQEVLALLDEDKDGRISEAEANNSTNPKILKGWKDAEDLDKSGYFEERDWELHVRKRSSINSIQKIRLGGTGNMTEKSAGWKYGKSLPNVPSPLLYRDVIFMVKDGAIVTSLDPASGEVFKQGRSKDAMNRYFASPVGGDGKVYLLSEAGAVSVLSAAPQWEVLQVNLMSEPCYATPALVNGKIYLRTETALYCFKQE